MKTLRFFLPIIAGASFVLPVSGQSAVELIQDKAVEAKAEPGDLAGKLGFAAHIPKNTEGYLSVIGAYDMYQRALDTDLGKMIKEVMAEQGADLEELEEDDEFSIFKAVVGEEFFVAFGDGAGEQAVHLAAINKSYNFQAMKMLVGMITLNLSPDPDYEKMEDLFMGMFQGIIEDPEAGLATFEKSKMPPLTAGFKVSDPEIRAQIFDTMSGGLLMLANEDEFPGKEIAMKKDGVDLTGVTIEGVQLAALLRAEAGDEALKVFGNEQNLERFLGALKTKNLQIALGQKDDYVVVYVGDSLDGLSFPAKVEDSIVANEGMDFMKEYAAKDIRLLVFGEEEAFKTMAPSTEMVGSLALGLKAGLAESDFFGDTRDVQALLGHVARMEKAMVGMIDYTRTGVVGFLEDGFKIEGHGGSNLPSIDTKTPHVFAGLGDLEDVVFFSNSRSNPEFTSKLYDLLSSLGEAAYLMAGRTASLESEDSDLNEFGQMFKMFDQMGAKDLKEIWMALTVDWAQGTGNEGALIVDTKGTMPLVPGVPSPIIEEGLIPRIAYLTPITDRAKVSSAWKRIEGSIKSILETVKEMDGPPIPMQEIEAVTKEGVTYYKTQIQFSTSDARPVVGLSEKNFFFSTSEKFIGELHESLESGKAPVRAGSYTHIDFGAARGLAAYWVKLLEENADEIFENEFQRDDFKKNLPMVKKFLEAFEQLDGFTSHIRQEEGESRTSVHFNLK